jgi:hypothetical protein
MQDKNAMPEKPHRLGGWTIPDASPELRRLAISEAKRRGLKLHEFIAMAVLSFLGAGITEDGTSGAAAPVEPPGDALEAIMQRLDAIERRLGIGPAPKKRKSRGAPPAESNDISATGTAVSALRQKP